MKDKTKIITNFIAITFCVSVGISIGYNIPKNELSITNNDISITENNTDNTQYYNSQIAFYDDIIKDIDTIHIYNTNELTTEILTNRNGKIIIEKVIGKVINDNLDGKIINTIDTEYNYICYKSVDKVKKGNVVLTYFIYNPLSNIEDDILTRVDFIIDGKTI